MKVSIDDLIKNMERELRENFNKPTKLFSDCLNTILSTKNPKYAYILAKKNWKCVDIKSLQDIVYYSDNTKYILYFACNIQGTDKEALCRRLLEVCLSEEKIEELRVATQKLDRSKLSNLIGYLKSEVPDFDFEKFYKIVYADVLNTDTIRNRLKQAYDNGETIELE